MLQKDVQWRQTVEAFAAMAAVVHIKNRYLHSKFELSVRETEADNEGVKIIWGRFKLDEQQSAVGHLFVMKDLTNGQILKIEN